MREFPMDKIEDRFEAGILSSAALTRYLRDIESEMLKSFDKRGRIKVEDNGTTMFTARLKVTGARIVLDSLRDDIQRRKFAKHVMRTVLKSDSEG